MNPSRRLNIYLTEESKAYGYTLCIWGSGAILMHSFEVVPSTVLLYITGALLGFGCLAFTAYRGLFIEIKRDQEDTILVATMIHFLAALGTVSIAYFLSFLESAQLAFLLAGFNATVTYNVLMLAEVTLSHELQQLEHLLQKRLTRTSIPTEETGDIQQLKERGEKYLSDKFTE